MADLTAQRTLVKSPPELWTELSEVESLAKHLGELGEIRIVKVEPESTVAWEGDDVCGTVELEQSGWGTKVTFTATVPEPGPAAVAEPEPDPEPGPAAVAEPEPDPAPVAVDPEPVAAEPDADPVAAEPDPEPADSARRQGFLARWLFRRRTPEAEPEAVVPEAEPEPVPSDSEPVALDPEPVAFDSEPAREPVAADPASDVDADRVQAVLDGTLDALGQAHHRPFSRG